MKKLLAVLLATTMTIGLTACGGSSDGGASSSGGGSSTETAAASSGGPKIFKSVESNAYSSLDVHKEYYSWHTQFYGISESLFRITDDLSIEPWLADGVEIEENVATITLKDGICFSNGEAVTADMVKRNIERLAAENSRFGYMADWTLEAKDDKTLVITTPGIYPTLTNDLANAETGIMDLDNTSDFDNAPVCTGPFKVKEFVPQGDVTVERNENYWGGEVKLDGAVFYAMGDEESKLMAMQNGEIDGYVDISAASREIFESEPDSYTITTVPTERRVYALINSAKLDDAVREAICIGVDKNQIATYMNGLISAADGAFSADTNYGSVQAPAYDQAKAKELLEGDGYTLNASGIYEKDGKPLTITISCYQKRSVDTVAILMQEQLKTIGIDAQIKLEEDPDGTYMSTKDFEIGMYVSITDKAGEPFTFLNGAVASGSYMDVCGFGNAETDALIGELRFETDAQKAAELANEIMTQVYASNDYFFIGQYNKTSVLKAGAEGLGVNNPLAFYGIDANSTVG